MIMIIEDLSKRDQLYKTYDIKCIRNIDFRKLTKFKI